MVRLRFNLKQGTGWPDPEIVSAQAITPGYNNRIGSYIIVILFLFGLHPYEIIGTRTTRRHYVGGAEGLVVSVFFFEKLNLYVCPMGLCWLAA